MSALGIDLVLTGGQYLAHVIYIQSIFINQTYIIIMKKKGKCSSALTGAQGLMKLSAFNKTLTMCFLPFFFSM